VLIQKLRHFGSQNASDLGPSLPHQTQVSTALVHPDTGAFKTGDLGDAKALVEHEQGHHQIPPAPGRLGPDRPQKPAHFVRRRARRHPNRPIKPGSSNPPEWIPFWQSRQRWIEIEEHARQPEAPTQLLRSPNTFAKLATIKVRTLVIAADADLIAPPGLMWVWASHITDARWAVVPAAGHAIAWEKPEIFNATLIRFLRGDGGFPRVKDVPRP
jgi:pimeloyl-ACP methyl ester carboxylesterase